MYTVAVFLVVVAGAAGQDCTKGLVLNEFSGVESTTVNALNEGMQDDSTLESLTISPGKLTAVGKENLDGYFVSDLDAVCTDKASAYDTLEITWSSAAAVSLKVALLSGASDVACQARTWTTTTTTVQGGGSADVISLVPIGNDRERLHAVTVSIPAGATIVFKRIRFIASNCKKGGQGTVAAATPMPGGTATAATTSDATKLSGMASIIFGGILAAMITCFIQ